MVSDASPLPRPPGSPGARRHAQPAGRCVLLVEDNADHAFLVGESLKVSAVSGAAHHLHHVVGLAEAMAFLESPPHPTDVVLLDYSLTGDDGLVGLRRMLARQPDLPVIMTTGQGDERIAVEAMKLGARDYVVKDSRFPGNLAHVTDGVMARVQLEREVRAARDRRDRLIRELAVLTAVSDALGRYRDPEGLLAVGLDQAITVTGAAGGRIFLRESHETGEVLVDCICRGLDPEQVGGTRVLREGEGALPWQVVRGRTTRLLDALAQGGVGDASPEEQAWETVLSPLIYQDEVRGVLVLQSPAGGGLLAIDPAVYESLAAQLAIALENANLYRDVKESARELEAKVEQRTRELALANEQLRASARLKDEFLANVSHELRTPLNSIIGFTGVLLEGLSGPLTLEQHHQLSLVYDSARSLLSLINDLLDLTKIEAGRMTVSPCAFDLQELLDAAVQTGRQLATGKALEVRLGPAGDLEGEIFTDRGRLMQILHNLVGNAVKFTHQGEVVVSARTSGAGRRRRLEIEVSDTGIGINAEDLPLIFDKFRQLDGSAEREFQGSGLGLAISQRLAHLLGGELSVTSVAGEGSTFTVTLPVEVVP